MDLEDYNQTFYNNPMTGFFFLSVIGAAFIILFIIYNIITDSSNVYLYIIMIPILIIIISSGFYQDMYNRPYKIYILDDGILLCYSMRKDRFVSWKEMKSSCHIIRKDGSLFSRMTSGGNILIHNELIPIEVAPNIVIDIRRHYLEKIGRSLEKRSGSD